MKKLIIRKAALVFLLSSATSLLAQTRYGTNTGTGGGSYSSYFGYYAGYVTTGSNNTFLGAEAGRFNTTGFNNTFVGEDAGQTNTTGYYNTFLGNNAGYSNSTANGNTFIGYNSGYANTTGYDNVFTGYGSGYSNTQGFDNVFIGDLAGYANTTGDYNTFLGNNAGYTNSTATGNTFLGYNSGYANTSGYDNVFIGYNSGYANTTGIENVFIGDLAGQANIGGAYNTFLGNNAGYYNTEGNHNVALGYYAAHHALDGDQNVSIGYQAGYANHAYYNIFLGSYAGYSHDTGDRGVFLGHRAGYSNDGGQYGVSVGAYAGYYSEGDYNVLIGYYAGYSNNEGGNNVFIGYNTGRESDEGAYNVAVGDHAGYYTEGNFNAFFGANSGRNMNTGENNTFLGTSAGYNATGSSNVFIGYQAGYNETGNYKLYIDNTSTTAPLIWGDFSTHDVRINGDLDITQVLTIDFAEVNGNAHRSGLLEIAQNGSYTWSGISIEHNAASAWSFMGDEDDVGLYDDYNNEWAILYNENAGLDLYYNGGVKLSTSSDGVDVNGNLYSDGVLTTSLTASDISTGYLKIANYEVTDVPASEGVLYYDLNVSTDTDNGIYQHFTGGNGGAISHYSTEDGWGALLSTNNMQWITPQFHGLGIGIAAPEADLAVAGNIRAATDNSEAEYLEIGHDGSNAYINATGSGDLNFTHEGGAAAMTITETGNVGIGTTDPSAEFALDVNGEIVTNGLAIENELIIDAEDSKAYFRNQTDTAITIVNNEGQLAVELPTEVTFGGGIHLNRDEIWDDPTMDDLLVVDPGSGRLKRRSASSIESPWLFEVVDTLLIVGQDGEVVGETEDGGAIQVDIIDLYGNISIGPNAYIDDDWMVGNDYYEDNDSLAADDWMKFSDFIEFQSSHNSNGIVLHDNDPYSYDYLNLFHKEGISYFANGSNEDYFMKAQGFEVEFRDKVKLPEVRTSVASGDSSIYLIADVNNSYEDSTATKSIVFGKNGDPLDDTNGTFRELMRIEETGNVFIKDLAEDSTQDHVVVHDFNTGQLSFREAGSISPWTEWPSGNITFDEGTVGIGMFSDGEATESLEIGSGNLRVWELGAAPFTTGTDRVVVASESGLFQVRDAYTFSPWTWTLGGADITYGSTQITTSGNITGTDFYGNMIDIATVNANNVTATNTVSATEVNTTNLDATTVDITATSVTKGLRLINNDADGDYNGQEVFRVYGSGYVEAKEMLLHIDGWEDRVFDPAYDLMPLEEVEDYVKANNHLPEVPSEKEVVENGIEVADMERLLMKKVEELTLHLIEQNKQMKEQMDLLQAQSERIEELEKLVQE